MNASTAPIPWIECSLLRARRAEDGVLEVQIKRRAEVTLESATAALAVLGSLAGAGGPALAIVDLARVHGTRREARRCYREVTDAIRALVARVALVAHTRLAGLVARGLLELDRTIVPARVFRDPAAARAWLLA